MVRRKPATRSKSIRSKVTRCALCLSDSEDPFRLGDLGVGTGIAIHNFCALFASGLCQNGEEDEGIEGFLVKDVLNEVRRANRLRCSYCKHVGATIGCCVQKCKKVFHLQCGQKNGALNQFFGSFISFCKAHRPCQGTDLSHITDWECSICGDAIDKNDRINYLKTSCCLSGLFHRDCVQKYAISSGYFFKCPLCNNTETFREEMLYHGVYIPEKDAAWETEENAYEELLDRPSCGAEKCVCPEGRDTDKKNTIWFLRICGDCGGSAKHVGCDDQVVSNIRSKRAWQCAVCTVIMNDRQNPNRLTNQSVSSTQRIEDPGEYCSNRSIPNERNTEIDANKDATVIISENSRLVEASLPTEQFVTIIDDNSDKFIDVCALDSDSCQEMPASKLNEVDANPINLDDEKLIHDKIGDSINFSIKDSSTCLPVIKQVNNGMSETPDLCSEDISDCSDNSTIKTNNTVVTSTSGDNDRSVNNERNGNSIDFQENSDKNSCNDCIFTEEINLLSTPENSSKHLHDKSLNCLESCTTNGTASFSTVKQMSLEKYITIPNTLAEIGDENSNSNNGPKRQKDTSKRLTRPKRRKANDIISQNKTLFDMRFFQQDKI